MKSLLRTLSYCAVLTLAPLAQASSFYEYGNNSHIYEIDLPPVTGGWFVAVAAFPAGSPVIQGYDLSGRLLAANDDTLFLQKNYGSDVWVPVATVTGMPLDPSFLKISPDGSTIALGSGYGQDLLVFSSALLNISAPPVLTGHSQVREFENIDYYDADFYGNDLLLIQGGGLTSSGWGSGVFALDLLSSPSAPVHFPLLLGIPGASGGIAVDADFRVITGIGYAPPDRTGELKMWSAEEISDVLFYADPALDYESSGQLIAENVLSAAALGFDDEGNLHVGGGDAFGSGGAAESGYAALISKSALEQAFLGLSGPIDELSTSAYTQLTPDPCQDDSALSPITFNSVTGALAIAWNPTGNPSSTPPGACYAAGSGMDYWNTGITPRMTFYFPDDALDDDLDGIPNGADNAYLTPNPDQRDTDGDGWGNMADADFNNDGVVDSTDQTIFWACYGSSWGDPTYIEHVDMNGDQQIDLDDYLLLAARYGTSAPFY